MYNSKYGIIINQSYNKVNNCSFRKNGYALSLFSSSNIFIDNCSFDHNSIGLILNIDDSNDIITKYCFLYGNGISCFFNNSNYLDFYHCNVSDNSVNIGGIFIISCRNININNSNVNHNGVGFGI